MILAAASSLAKGFAGRTLFQNISFGIDSGDRAGLVGPNGAGKSTLLRLLAGELEPDAGTVIRKKGLRLGFLRQTPEFPAGQTVFDAVLSGGGDDADHASALMWLAKLELNRFDPDFAVSNLSGGWLKRVALARELMREPELLLLDEPTNHLDVSGILWLEDFLRQAPCALLMITHDRLFLQRVCSRILDLDPRNPGHLLDISGGYLPYLEAKENELAAQKRHERVLANTLRREKEWLSRGSIARQTKQSARIQSAAALEEQVAGLRARNQKQKAALDFGTADRGPKKLIEASGLGKSYDGQNQLFTGLDLLVTPDTRLALIGDNGCGKSTLVRILLGLEQPSSGVIKRADSLAFAHFEQNRETLDPNLSVLKNICPEGDYVEKQGQFIHVRSYLDRFLFRGPQADLPAGKLSGGEQARLRLAQLMLRPAQVVILDEPTNDLDADTLQVLEDALDDFNGAVILVTHDRYFMDAVADQILAFPAAENPDRRLHKFAGYFQWESWHRSQQTPAKPTPRPGTTAPPAPAKTKLSYKDKYELENMESVILQLEGEIATLSEESRSPAVMSDHQRLGPVLERLARLQSELEAKYERWAQLEAQSKGLS